VAVVDVKTGDTATGNFTVTTAYYLNVSVPTLPTQLQEGDSVPISVNVTGAPISVNSSSPIAGTITVLTPSNASYTENVNILTSALGSGNATFIYPGNFSGGANTNYVGTYKVSLNLSNATMPFNVGLTNSTEYHRMQTVDIKAIYAKNETVTVAVSGTDIFGKSLYSPVNVTADSAGVVDSNWTVPATASVGPYSVSVVSVSGPTVKVPPDIQNFTVPGFALNVTAKNLAQEPVPNVEVVAYEQQVSVYTQTTDSEGLAVLMLEIGNYTLKGYSNGVMVGEDNFSVTNSETGSFVCNLTDLNIQVVGDVNGVVIGIPDVTVYLAPEGMTLATNIAGNVVAHSLLPNATYVLNASRYDALFNVTTIQSLIVDGNLVPFFNVTIFSPSFTLKVSVFKADGQPFGDAAVNIKELIGGISYEGNTDSNGTITFLNVTFGRYDVEIYDSTGLELNSTILDIFQDQNATLYCNLFGLSINVKVTDYFGQPFTNTIITLQGNGSEPISERTQSNGIVTFDNLVGSSFSVAVYLSDKGPPTVVDSLMVQGSTTVPIAINKYVLFAGFPVEMSQFATAIVILLTLLLILVLEVYRRRRSRSKKIDN
jgi:hypothetical protein